MCVIYEPSNTKLDKSGCNNVKSEFWMCVYGNIYMKCRKNIYKLSSNNQRFSFHEI